MLPSLAYLLITFYTDNEINQNVLIILASNARAVARRDLASNAHGTP
jgi:hypothetical protein